MAQGVRTREGNSLRFSHAVVMLFITSIVCMGLLSMLRSDTHALDEQLGVLQSQLVACEKECRDLEREAAAMMSPRAVYNYAVKQGMTQAHLAGAVRIDGIGRPGGTATASLITSGTSRTH